MIPVRAERGEHEAHDWGAGGVADFDLELGRVDGAFVDAVFGAAAAHARDAAAHIVAFELVVCDYAAVVAELVGVVRGEVFGAEVVVAFGKFGGVECSYVAKSTLVGYSDRRKSVLTLHPSFDIPSDQRPSMGQ
jgi:hypothetical protein